MTDFALRVQRVREAFPDQVICAFLHPDGLEVIVPISPELLASGQFGGELMRVHNDAAVEARAEQARREAGR